MEKQILPSKAGQILRCLTKVPGKDENESYILAEDPIPKEDDTDVAVYSVTDFLRSHSIGQRPIPIRVSRSTLSVVAENMKEWVDSWNKC